MCECECVSECVCEYVCVCVCVCVCECIILCSSSVCVCGITKVHFIMYIKCFIFTLCT